jgi:DNA polymerase III delta subunit
MPSVSVSEAMKILDKNNVIVTVGEENYYRDQIRNKIILSNKDLDIIRFDAKENEENEILNNLTSKDLFSSKRIFIIKNFTEIKKLDFLLEKSFSDIILLDADKKAKSKNFKEIEKKFLFIECLKPNLWDQETDAVNKIKLMLNKEGLIISPDISKYLYSHLGYNLYRIMREIQKIVLLKQNDTNKNISKEDIDSICVSNINYNIFDIIDKILEGNKKEAIDIMNRLFVYENNSGILLISLWYSHFESLLLCQKRELMKRLFIST